MNDTLRGAQKLGKRWIAEMMAQCRAVLSDYVPGRHGVRLGGMGTQKKDPLKKYCEGSVINQWT